MAKIMTVMPSYIVLFETLRLNFDERFSKKKTITLDTLYLDDLTHLFDNRQQTFLICDFSTILFLVKMMRTFSSIPWVFSAMQV